MACWSSTAEAGPGERLAGGWGGELSSGSQRGIGAWSQRSPRIRWVLQKALGGLGGDRREGRNRLAGQRDH